MSVALHIFLRLSDIKQMLKVTQQEQNLCMLNDQSRQIVFVFTCLYLDDIFL